MSHVPFVNASLGRAMWRSAYNWIAVWTGAGFPPKVDGDRIVMPAEWKEKFPDGPGLIQALRNEMIALLAKGGAAFSEDDRLKVPAYQPLYVEYLTDQWDLLSSQSSSLKYAAGKTTDVSHADENRKRAAEKDQLIAKLKAEIADLKRKGAIPCETKAKPPSTPGSAPMKST